MSAPKERGLKRTSHLRLVLVCLRQNERPEGEGIETCSHSISLQSSGLCQNERPEGEGIETNPMPLWIVCD